MKLKVEPFKNVIRKSTFNFSIETTTIKIKADRINSSMVNRYNTGIAILDIENNAITDMEEMEFEFHFLDPDQHLMPFLNLLDVEEVTLKVHQNKITLYSGRQRSTIHFCTPNSKRIFHSEAALRSSEYFTTLPLGDGKLFEMWDKIKKVGTRFGRVYFNVKNGNFTIETSDKTNKFANSLLFLLSKLKYDDLSLCYEFNDMANLMKIIDEQFSIGFTYDEGSGLGLLHAEKEDSTENFFLMSKKE